MITTNQDVSVMLSQEAFNCLEYWRDHPMYPSTLSEVVLQQMEEWLNRDMTSSPRQEVRAVFEDIKRGDR